MRPIKNYTNDRHTLLILSVDETVLAVPRTPDIRGNIAQIKYTDCKLFRHKEA